MPDFGRWLSALAWAATFVSGMAVLVAGIALALGTTGHDWHAAWKLTLTEAMLGVGFSDYGLIEYGTANGETMRVERYRLAYVMDEAWLARRRILSLAANHAVMGACAGLALSGIWFVVRMALRLRRLENGRATVIEPAPRPWPGHASRMRHPDDWSDGELIAALARRSGRLGVLLVSPEEIGRLSGDEGADAGHAATPRHLLPSARASGLPSPERAKPHPEAAVPAKRAPADHGIRPDTDEPEGTDEDGAVARSREPGEEFF